jgi:hypothetical protein
MGRSKFGKLERNFEFFDMGHRLRVSYLFLVCFVSAEFPTCVGAIHRNWQHCAGPSVHFLSL